MGAKVLVKVLQNGIPGQLPEYMTEGSSGADLKAAIEGDMNIAPMSRALIPTGISIALPEGFEGQVRPRSGLAAKYGVTLLNSPGTIDSDYRGEIKVVLINLGDVDFKISRGDRIAQLVICRIEKSEFSMCESLEETDRGSGGFGHTGA